MVDVRVDSFAGETGWDHRRDWKWPGKYPLFGQVVHQEWAGSQGGLDRVRERRSSQFPAVLFGPTRDPRHCDQVLHSRGNPAHSIVVQQIILCDKTDGG